LVCRECGKAIEPPPSANGIPAPPTQATSGSNDRWSEGPPEDSANRWSAQPPLGEESSSSESVSQTSILPMGGPAQPALVRPPRTSLAWALIVLAVFLAALIGVVVLARSIRPWLAARSAAAQRATVEFWWPKLSDGDDEARREAARAIVALGPKAVCRTLDRISKDPGDGQPFRFDLNAARALAGVGEEAVPALCEGLRSPEPKVRAAAVEVLQQMGAPARGACASLLTALDDQNRWIRYDTIVALGYLATDGAPAVQRLSEFVDSPDLVARRHAIEALGRIGPAAHDAAKTLEKAAAEDADITLRSAASLALKQVDLATLAREARREATGDMGRWLKALAGDDTAAAIAAAEALGDLRLKGLPAAPGLALMLRHTDRGRRLAAAIALGHLGLAATDFTPTLEVAAKDEDAGVRAAAVQALESIGKP